MSQCRDAAYLAGRSDVATLWVMAFEWLAPVAPAVATIVAGSFGLIRGEGRLRQNLRHDAETLEHLPNPSAAREALTAHVEWQAKLLTEREREGSRSWRRAIDAAVWALASGYASVWVYLHHWPVWLQAPIMVGADCVLLINLARLVAALAIKKRDARGRVIE